MTKKRRQLLEFMQGAEEPRNASQVHNCLQDLADLATVYRGLQYLEAEGYLSSFVFDCHDRGIERYYFSSEGDHRHFMHCHRCHRFIPIPHCPLKDSLAAIEAGSGFRVDDHSITLTGLCRDCR